MVGHLILDENGGDYWSTQPQPDRLDLQTPLGMFLGEQYDRYLVSEVPNGHCAVVLQHPKWPSFTLLDLGKDSVDCGVYLGKGSWYLRDDTAGTKMGKPKLGNLKVGAKSIKLRVRRNNEGCIWLTVARGNFVGRRGIHSKWYLGNPVTAPFFGQ